MTKNFLFLILTFLCSSAFCQDSYITPQGTTIEGSLKNYREWSKNPTSVLFKTNGGDTITLTPQNCAGFTSGQDKFIAYHGTRVVNSDNVIFSLAVLNEKEIKDTIDVFLRQIYQHDNYVLYKLFDNKRINFYLAKNGDIHELEFYETITNDQAVPFNLYKTYLTQEFAGAGITKFEHKLSLLTYKENSLLNFFADAFGDRSNATEKLRNKYPTEILLGLGANANSANLREIYDRYNYNETSVSPSIELAIRIYGQRNFGKIFFQPSVSGSFLNNTFNPAQLKIRAVLFNINLGAGYMIVKKDNFSFYAAAAGAFPVFHNYETFNPAGGKYVGTNGPDSRLSVRPELGVLINRTWNVSLATMFPVKLAFTSDVNYVYNLTQTSVMVRYALIQGHGKK